MRAVLDTLFGHTSAARCLASRPRRRDSGALRSLRPVCSSSIAPEVNCIDMFQAKSFVTGGEDKTTRFWKTAQASHLLFAHGGGAVPRPADRLGSPLILPVILKGSESSE